VSSLVIGICGWDLHWRAFRGNVNQLGHAAKRTIHRNKHML
jgi:hypothetical protein